MAAPTTYFVDPSIAGDSGSGTIGSPYGDVKYAIDSNSWDATNGVKLCVKSGTSEILTENLITTLATNSWTPTQTAPFMVRGYTSTEDDGGRGTLDGNGSISIFNSTTVDGVILVDMVLTNSGGAVLCVLDDYCLARNVLFSNSTGGRGVAFGNESFVIDCQVADVEGAGSDASLIAVAAFSVIDRCFVDSRGVTNAPDRALEISSTGVTVTNNIVAVDGDTHGVYVGSGGARASHITGNIIFANAGTGAGIYTNTNGKSSCWHNNYIEGFSGTGGKGIWIDTSGLVTSYVGNRFYNNATQITNSGYIIDDGSVGADALGSSGLTAPGSDDFTPTSDLEDVGYPTTFPGISQTTGLNVGAVQNEATGGAGGLLTHPGMAGGIRG